MADNICLKQEATKVKVDLVRLETSSELDDHLRSSTTILRTILSEEQVNTYKKYTCKLCGKLYKTANTLRSHKQLKHPTSGDSTSLATFCEICNKQYPSAVSLRKHNRYMHLFKHRCTACYRTFQTVTLLEEHLNCCSPKKTPCPVCGNVYKNNVALRNHTKYKHANMTWNTCSLCHRTFSSARNLTNHMNIVHPPGVSCVPCGKEFTSAAAMQSHMLYKHNEHGARCKQCYKVFATPARLERHVAKRHFINNYSCIDCKIEFNSTCQLMKHVATVHGKDKHRNPKL